MSTSQTGETIYDEGGYVDYSNFAKTRLLFEKVVKKDMPKTADVEGQFFEIDIYYNYNTKNGVKKGKFYLQFPLCWCSGLKVVRSKKTNEVICKKMNPQLDHTDPEHQKCIKILREIYVEAIKYLHKDDVNKEVTHLAKEKKIKESKWEKFEADYKEMWGNINSLLFYGEGEGVKENPCVPCTLFGSKPFKTDLQKEKMKNAKAEIVKKYKVCKICPPSSDCVNQRHPRVKSEIPHSDLERFRIKFLPLIAISTLVITKAQKIIRTSLMSAIVHELKPMEAQFRQEKELVKSDIDTKDITEMERMLRSASIQDVELEQYKEDTAKKEAVDGENEDREGEVSNNIVDDTIETF